MSSLGFEGPVYDSSARARPSALWREAWERRELVILLTRREVSGRYRQALLGAWWTLITPFAYAGALWIVFSEFKEFASEGVPYIVYVLSGVIVFNFVSQAVLGVAGAVVTNAVHRRRTFVPVGVFAAASALAAGVSLAIMTAALMIAELVSGETIPLTALLLPLYFVVLCTAVAGVGLLIGTLATVYIDAVEMIRLLLTLASFFTPLFYPIAIVPERYRILVELNPIYQYLVCFRDLAYGGRLPPVTTLAACLGIAAGVWIIGLIGFGYLRELLPSLHA